MRRLIRNIEGDPLPLIMHRRLYRLRVIDQRVRFAACKVMGWQYHRPRYMNAQRTPEQQAELRLACRSFIGARSPDPRVARYHFELGRWILLADPGVSEQQKRSLVAEGPRCTPEDEAYVLTTMDPTPHDIAEPEDRIALARVKSAAEATVERLAEASS